MATPNAALAALIREFGQQPGVTREEAQQLRVAIHRSQALTDRLEAAIADGRLEHFRVTRSPHQTGMGHYDEQAHLFYIPEGMLRGTARSPNAHLPGALAVLDVVSDFAAQNGVTREMSVNLQGTINASSALAAQLRASTSSDSLRQFEALPPGTNAGGEFNPANRHIRLPLAQLAAPVFDPAETAFVLGHEVQHSLNRAASDQGVQAFVATTAQIAQTNAAERDYTPAVRQFIDIYRRDEAGAEIAGWNAHLDIVRRSHPNPTMEQLYNAAPGRMQHFIDVTPGANPGDPPTYALKPNLALDADLTMAASAHNLAAMGTHYFDMPPHLTRIGAQGTSDYPNYYGAAALSYVLQVERAQPQRATVQIDMAGLRLDDGIVHQNGLNFGGPDFEVYQDTGTQPPGIGIFTHTAPVQPAAPTVAATLARIEADALEEQRRAALARAEAEEPPSPAPIKRKADDLTADGNAPDREPGGASKRYKADARDPLLAQSLAAVARLDEQQGRTPDAASERLAASMASAARQAGLERVDHVVVAENGASFFAVQGALDDPAHRRVQVDGRHALATPVEQSLQQLALASPSGHAVQDPAQAQERQPAFTR